jgi:hypothetical protein
VQRRPGQHLSAAVPICRRLMRSANGGSTLFPVHQSNTQVNKPSLLQNRVQTLPRMCVHCLCTVYALSMHCPLTVCSLSSLLNSYRSTTGVERPVPPEAWGSASATGLPNIGNHVGLMHSSNCWWHCWHTTNDLRVCSIGAKVFTEVSKPGLSSRIASTRSGASTPRFWQKV